MRPNSAPAPSDPPRRRGRLREVPGGYDLDTPPIHITPIEGESAVSWLRRAALRYQISPRNVLYVSGAIKQITSTRAATTRITGQGNAFTTRLGLSQNEREMLRERTSLGHALYSYSRLYQHPQTQGAETTSRYCPACLDTEVPIWPKDWSHPLLALCPDHGLLLLDRCPACDAIPYASPTWLGAPLELSKCTARTPAEPGPGRRVRPWCGHDLRTAPTEAATAEQLRAQHLLLNLAHDPDEQVELCGITVNHRIGFDAMVELLAAALHSRGTHPLDPTEPTCEVATGLADTLLVLGTTNPLAAGEHLQQLVLPTDPQAPITLPTGQTSRVKNPLLGALQLGYHREHLSAASQLAFRTGATHPRYPFTAKKSRAALRHLQLPEHREASWPLTLAQIAQVIWPDSLPGLKESDPIARAEISLLLAHLGTTRPWSHLTLDLGLPRGFHATLARRIRARRTHGTWPTLLTQLEGLLERLQSQPPWTNYRHRRLLADDHSVLEQALALADPDQRPPALAIQRRFWELLTSGDALFAPQPVGIETGQHPAWTRCRQALDREHAALFEAAFQILERSSPLRLGKPLCWRPP